VRPLPTGRSGIGGVVVRGCFYVMGGEGSTQPGGVFRENEVYDPRNDTWEAVAPMRTPRHGIGAAAVGNVIYVPGGGNVQGFGTVGVNEAFTVPAAKSCD